MDNMEKNKYKDKKVKIKKTQKEYKEQELAPWKGLSVWIAWMEGHEEKRGGQLAKQDIDTHCFFGEILVQESKTKS